MDKIFKIFKTNPFTVISSIGGVAVLICFDLHFDPLDLDSPVVRGAVQRVLHRGRYSVPAERETQNDAGVRARRK